MYNTRFSIYSHVLFLTGYVYFHIFIFTIYYLPGPLPDKAPLTVEHPLEPSAPPRPPSATSQVRLVTPVPPPETELQFNVEVPFEFLCPITNKIMSDPVTAADGYNYERKAIRRWFRKKRSSPMTNETLVNFNVRANDELRSRIESFVGDHSVV